MLIHVRRSTLSNFVSVEMSSFQVHLHNGTCNVTSHQEKTIEEVCKMNNRFCSIDLSKSHLEMHTFDSAGKKERVNWKFSILVLQKNSSEINKLARDVNKIREFGALAENNRRGLFAKRCSLHSQFRRQKEIEEKLLCLRKDLFIPPPKALEVHVRTQTLKFELLFDCIFQVIRILRRERPAGW